MEMTMITFNLIRSDRPVLLISSALFILLQLNSITGWAHGDGEEHKPAPEILINSSGESIATDGTTYLTLETRSKQGLTHSNAK